MQEFKLKCNDSCGSLSSSLQIGSSDRSSVDLEDQDICDSEMKPPEHTMKQNYNKSSN